MKRVGLQFKRLNLGVTLTALCLGLSCFGVLDAQTRITNSTTMKVNPGTVITNQQDMLLSNGGVLNNQGTMVINGNLQNNSGSANLGTGTFVFSGSAAQTISGQNTFRHLKINNAAGVGIVNDIEVIDTLELTAGLLKLRNANLKMDSTCKAVGTFSGTAMVAADTSGQLRKIIQNTGVGSFLFPVGDTVGN